jgi:hypothetical protein
MYGAICVHCGESWGAQALLAQGWGAILLRPQSYLNRKITVNLANRMISTTQFLLYNDIQ